jgi:hypothetical protein
VGLLHVPCYPYSSARAAGPDEPGGWRQYRARVRMCWRGRVAGVLVELGGRQERPGEPPAGGAGRAEGRRDPRRLVAGARGRPRDDEERTDYPRYRREGLPAAGSPVESLVGESNARVKGEQKHWSRPAGAEPILRPRAALLGGDGRLGRFFRRAARLPVPETTRREHSPRPSTRANRGVTS